jgi:hypothetical protein
MRESGLISCPEKGRSDRSVAGLSLRPGPGRYDPPSKSGPDTAPDSRIPIPPLPGKARKTPRLGSHGKQPQITPRLPKYARFRCPITGHNRVWTGDLFATSNHPCDPGIGQKNAAKYVRLKGGVFTTGDGGAAREFEGKQAGGFINSLIDK